MEDLSISQINEQKTASIKAIIKDSMQQNPKILRKIFKAIQPEAIFDFTKLFYFQNEKEKAMPACKSPTCTTAFISIPSIRYLSYKLHSLPKDDITKLSVTENTVSTKTNNDQRSTTFSELTHENSWNALNKSSFSSDDDQSSKSPKSSLQALNKISKRAQWMKVSDAPPTISQFQRPTQFPKPTTISTRYKKQNSRTAHLNAYTDTQTKSHYVKKSHYQQTSSKILLKKASKIPNSEVNLQPKVTQGSQFQEEITSTNFPALPSQTIAPENLLHAKQTQFPTLPSQTIVSENLLRAQKTQTNSPTLPNSQHQFQFQPQSFPTEIDGHRTTQLLILELLNKCKL